MPGPSQTGWIHLLEIVALLRSEDGCPWDRAQTLKTMGPHLLEETHEVLETLSQDQPAALREELGDVLFNVVMMGRIAEEAGHFTIDEVAEDIAQKMIVRHPHVFEPGEHELSEGTVAAWEARKAEKADPERSRLDGLPSTLPALLHAYRAGEKASHVGLDWPDLAGARAKLDEELQELDSALHEDSPERSAQEYGDVLLAAAQVGRHLGICPEEALRVANSRFGARFRAVEQGARKKGVLLQQLDPEALDALWRRAKEEE